MGEITNRPNGPEETAGRPSEPDGILRDGNRFYMGVDPAHALAEVRFTPTGDGRFIIDGTFVSPTLKGRGIGRQLVGKVAELARQENRRITPHCSFARKVLLECAECSDLVVLDGDEPFSAD